MSGLPETLDRDACAALDAADPLAAMRGRFLLEGLIYLDGNSLGALPAATPPRLAEVVAEEWGRGLIRSWNDAGWIEAPRRLGDKVAPLIGAEAGEVLVADSTSVNLFKLLGAAVRARPGRRVILSHADNFPADLYVAQGLCELLEGGCELRTVAPQDLGGALDEDVAVLMVTHVDYATGAVQDMPALCAAARACGALSLWDLSHSTAALPVDLGGCGADLAVGCGYKYLSGGPGAPAFLYVARRLQDSIRSPLRGWMGHAEPFVFEPGHRHAPGVAGFLCGTPPILGMAALEAALDLWLEVDLGAVRAKSVRLGDLLIRLVDERCAGLGLDVASPRDG
ncbi:MAG TPA: aminotransferase class V-fold PLP-dependent enzyme, partial [Candidatus Dormibacteraeota bacterium]